MKNVFGALAKAKPEFGKATKDSVNSFLGNKYSSINQYQDAADSVLLAHGLVYTQTVSTDAVETILVHWESGESIVSRCPLFFNRASEPYLEETVDNRGNVVKKRVNPNPMQAFGSAVTYARRYALEALLGIQRGDDDDAEGAYPRHQGQQGGKVIPIAKKAEEVKQEFVTVNYEEVMALTADGVLKYGAARSGRLKEADRKSLKTILQQKRDEEGAQGQLEQKQAVATVQEVFPGSEVLDISEEII